MGLLINREWQEHEPGMTQDGHFERQESAFHAMSGRYYLCVSR